MKNRIEIENYNAFVNKLKNDLSFFKKNPRSLWLNKASLNIDGLASKELRRLVPIEIRRNYGTFFTESNLASHVLNILNPSLENDSIIYDPACGAGNLLIASSKYIIDNGINPTNRIYLLGTDIHKTFVTASNLRLNTQNLINNSTKRNYEVKVNNGLEANPYYRYATHIFVNPPFNQIETDKEIGWAKGKVNAAALFIDKIIDFIKPGTEICAILPDVLRSGSRYSKWRNYILTKCTIEKIEKLGQFDRYTDIDVFAIKIIKRENELITKLNSFELRTEKNKKLSEFYDICVGPVVDNRDKVIGIKRCYIKSRGLLGWQMYKKIETTRKYSGKCFSGPLVVVKRTSRMGDGFRAIGTIINTPNPVYIDNHLIVIKPKSGKIEDCYKLLTILKDVRTTNWLNEAIRCRHLTVHQLSKLPLWE